MMLTREEIIKLDLNEKILMMEYLWDELSKTHADEVIPQWHNKVLEERKQKIDNGKAIYHSFEDIRTEFSGK